MIQVSHLISLIFIFLESKTFEYLFYRGDTFYTTVIPVSQYVYYLIMNIIGTTFINVVNLQNVRKNPFLDTYYTYDSLKKTIFIACPCLFFATSMIMLRGRYDLQGYCDG
jgi:hypothetical protein